VIEFDEFELDLARFELRRGGSPVQVERQVFDLLTYLVRAQGRVVTKEELLDNVWGTRFVTESALTTQIKFARRALGDDGTKQRFIRTVHRRGY
jgi:DNA-binding winged helix-turn-helix (wHTH) protein